MYISAPVLQQSGGQNFNAVLKTKTRQTMTKITSERHDAVPRSEVDPTHIEWISAGANDPRLPLSESVDFHIFQISHDVVGIDLRPTVIAATVSSALLMLLPSSRRFDLLEV